MTESRHLLTRRELLGVAGLAGVTAVAGPCSRRCAADRAGPTPYRLSRELLGCSATRMRTGSSPSCWMATGGRARTRLRASTSSPSTSISSTPASWARKICRAKNIPIYKTVGEAVTLGGTELAVDGVVIVGRAR